MQQHTAKALKGLLTVTVISAIVFLARDGMSAYSMRQAAVKESLAVERAQQEKPSIEVAPTALPPPPPQSTKLEVTAEGMSVEIPEDTSWQTILQILVLVLGLYGGIRIINKYTHVEEAEPV